MKTKIKILLSVFVLCINFSILMASVYYLNVLNFNQNNNDNNFYVDPIIIDGDGWPNWNWAVSQSWCNGSGTYDDPYLIRHLHIETDSDTNCLEIIDSNVYFIIDNCTFLHSGHFAGVKLMNVRNGVITSNLFIIAPLGIYLLDSSKNEISGNKFRINTVGIKLENSNNNTINYNNISDNKDGIKIDGSNNAVFNNYIIDSDQSGIIVEGTNNNLQNNIMVHCGIIAVEPSHKIDTTNLINNKPMYYYSNEIGLSSNDFSNAGQVILVNCLNCSILGLNLTRVTRGITLVDCMNTNISFCTISDNYLHGIILIRSSNNVLLHNELNANNEDGIFLYDSSINNTISQNNFLGNGMSGLTIYGSCDDNVVSYNKFESSRIHAVEISFSEGNNFLYNEFIATQRYEAVRIDYSSYNSFLGNSIRNNHGTHVNLGIHIRDSSSQYNLFYNNMFINNGNHSRDDGNNNQWDNGSIGNYWSDYTGVDPDDDGIGNLPYNITGSSGSKDNYPIWDDGPG